MVSLTTLRHEILLAIVQSIDKPSALLSLLRCSRFLFHLTLPHLYHHITILTPQRCISDEEFHEESSESLKRLYAFTCYITASPELASRVRVLEVDASGQSNRSLLDLLAPLPDISADLQYAAVTASHSCCEGRNWINDIGFGYSEDALLALLLPNLPQLKRLHIVFPTFGSRCNRMLRTIAHRGGLCLPDTAFGCLQHVIGQPTTLPTRLGFSWEQMVLLLQIPSMHSIEGDLRSNSNNNRANLLPGRTSNIKIINVTTEHNHPET